MVNAAPELQDEVEVEDGFDAEDENLTDELNETDAKTEPSLVETDPLAEIREQITKAASKEELDGLRGQIRSELGRAQKLEARLNEMAGLNPLADVDPRLDANEALLTSIADALISSDLADDQAKAALRAARSGLDEAKGKRAQNRMRAEMLDEVKKFLPQPKTDDEAPPENPWLQANNDVVAELAERLPDFDPLSIPREVWLAGKAKGTPARAVAHVLRWAEQQAEEPAATRTATRRQAAGSGSPARSGGPSLNDMDRYSAYGAGDIEIPEKELRALEARLKAKGEL